MLNFFYNSSSLDFYKFWIFHQFFYIFSLFTLHSINNNFLRPGELKAKHKKYLEQRCWRFDARKNSEWIFFSLFVFQAHRVREKERNTTQHVVEKNENWTDDVSVWRLWRIV